MHDLYRLIYASRARLPVGNERRPTVEHIVAASQRNNGAVGVTGLLLQHEGVFVQVLEGERMSVEAVFRRVSADLRHEKVRVISSQPVLEREFGAWTMCSRTLRPEDAWVLDAIGGELTDIEALEPEPTLNLMCAVAQMRQPHRRAA